MISKKSLFKVFIALIVVGVLFLSGCAVDPAAATGTTGSTGTTGTASETVTVKLTVTKDAAITGAVDYGVGIYIINTTTNTPETLQFDNPQFPFTYSYTKAKKGDKLQIWVIMGANNSPTNEHFGGSDNITVDTSAGGTISKDLFIKKF